MARASIRLVAALAAGVCAWAAGDVARDARGDGAPFWERARRPTPKETLRAEGLGHLSAARLIRNGFAYDPRDVNQMGVDELEAIKTRVDGHAIAALAAFEEALLLSPDDPDLHYGAVMSAQYLDEKRRDERFEKVVTHVEALLRQHPMHSQAYMLGDAYVHALAKLGQRRSGRAALALFERAAIAYEIHLARTDDARMFGVRADSPYSNAAEIYMAAGRLDEAVALYRRSVELGPLEALNHYGLALALDRAGEGDSALAEMREAIRLDTKGQLAAADEGDDATVYFVPKGDKLAYQALALEAQGRTADAARMWTAFLKVTRDAQPAYRTRAEQHVARLGRQGKP